MTSSAAGPARPTLAWTELRTPAVEAFGQLALIGLALAVVGRQDPAGWAARTTAVLVLAAGVAAAVLLATAGRVSDNRRAVRMAGAVGVHAAVVLLPTAAGAGPATGAWSVATSVALLGVVGFLALAVRASADRRGDRISATLVAAVVAVAAAATAALARQAPELVPPGWVVLAADLVVWSGTASAAGLMVLAGAVADRALLRGTGLAFATLALANAVRIGTGGPVVPALELAAMTMLLVVAVRFGRAGVATAAGCRARLVEAENALAGSRTATADRDQELRELVAALSGATRELAGDGRLPAAAAAGFDRLRDLVDAGSGPLRAPLGPVLHDIAEVHRANGLDVRVEVDGDPD
ncbi:MAG TPA: hypothetical protein VEZ42_12610, partial [Pseudonocardia sp.]|nr:hypothetical protein [Pseudonocardia sp.]